MADTVQGANQAACALRASDYNSGSDSWDPINAGPHIANEESSFSSKDAHSRAQAKVRQADGSKLQQSNDEELDLGGEGGGGERGVATGENGTRMGRGGSGEAVIKNEEDTMKVIKEDTFKAQEGENMTVKPGRGENSYRHF